jgi:type VII secretion protein EccE
MSPARSQGSAPGFTKPPMLGVHVSQWRAVVVVVVCAAWITASWGRLHPVLVALAPLAVMVVALATIYHVSLTRWVQRWWSWRRHRRDRPVLPSASAARDVDLGGGLKIGVVNENEALVTMVELIVDPTAPTVVADNEERTINTISVTTLASMLTLADVKLSSIDLIADGHRAAGGFADLYQQMIGPVPAAAARRAWIVLRIAMTDNLAAIARRGSRAEAAERTAAATCQRAADTLASLGIDARPGTAARIAAVNATLHTEAPIADHWSHLESLNSFTGIYYADPDHISVDAAQWWTWPQARNVSTLIRLTRTNAGPQIAALVRYRTDAPLPAPPVSRLGPLYGVQQAMWGQFRVGYVPTLAPIPSTMLSESDPVIPFGPTGPMIGSIGGPRDKTAVHLPLAGAITVLCQTSLLLRQVALRATATGRALIVVTDNPQQWSPIAALAESAHVVDTVPEDVPDDAILVIDGACPLVMPDVTVLTNDAAQAIPTPTGRREGQPPHSRRADIELVDADPEYAFTLRTRTGLSARVRAVPTHEERRLLGVSPPPPPPRPAVTPARHRAPTPPATPAAPAPTAPAKGPEPRTRPDRTPTPRPVPARPGATLEPLLNPLPSLQRDTPARPAPSPTPPTGGNGQTGRHRVPPQPQPPNFREDKSTADDQGRAPPPPQTA